MDAQFWMDLAMVIPAEVLPITALLAIIEARQDQSANYPPDIYP